MIILLQGWKISESTADLQSASQLPLKKSIIYSKTQLICFIEIMLVWHKILNKYSYNNTV